MPENSKESVLGQAPDRSATSEGGLHPSQEEHATFFRRMLGNVEEATRPFGLENPQVYGTALRESYLELPAGLARRLRERASQLGVSAASLCHLAWAQVLGRVSGREDVVFGTVLFARTGPGGGATWEKGAFLNVLPVRIALGDDSVEVGVRRTHKILGELMLHERASLSLAQSCSAVPAGKTLCSSLLKYRYVDGHEALSAEAKEVWEGIEGPLGEERTDYLLTLSVDDLGSGFCLTVQALEPIEPQRVCTYTQRALEELVEALKSTPDKALGSLDVMPAAERQRLLVEWNATEAEYPRDACVHELFEEQAERTPEAIALMFQGEALTYGELNRKANQLAHHLRRQGVTAETLVGLCVERSLEMVIGLLGILKAGGAYLPLDPEYPARRLAFMLEDAGVGVLCTQVSLAPLVSQHAGVTVYLDRDRGAIEAESEETPTSVTGPERLIYVIYTSGTTGRPKGALNEHRGLTNRLTWMQRQYALTAQDRVLQKTSFGFDVSGWEFFWPLMYGARLVLARPGGHRDPQYLADTIARESITTVHFVPSMMELFLEQEKVGRRVGH